MRVFLIHGMGRTPVSMWVLGQRLSRLGHRTSLFGYNVTVEALPTIAERFVDRVESELRRDTVEHEASGEPVPYAVIGHSLGNIVTRLASRSLPPAFVGFVMLAPPNRSPAIARSLRNNALFRWLSRDAGQRLADPGFYDQLPVPDVPSLIIAGTRGPRWQWLPFRGQANDSIVAVEETRLEGVPTITVHGAHTFLMNRRDVFERISKFLSATISG